MGWNDCVWLSYKHHPNTRQGAPTICLEVDAVAFFSAQEMESSIAARGEVDSSTYSSRRMIVVLLKIDSIFYFVLCLNNVSDSAGVCN